MRWAAMTLGRSGILISGFPARERDREAGVAAVSPAGVDALMPLAPTVDASFSGSNRSPQPKEQDR